MRGEKESWCSLELPLREAAETFDLEKAVCSHGLFMMSPNRWDPLSRSLSRPLRLHPPDAGDADDSGIDDSPFSAVARISQPQSASLRIQVYGVSSLTQTQRRSILAQVARMLRLSPADEGNVREFLKRVSEDEECLRSFGGRVFRSPTLFEDMVKCILLCNCQWSRTLSMARSLCELQWELQSCSSGQPLGFAAAEESTKSIGGETYTEDFAPKTPAPKDSKRKKQLGENKVSAKLIKKLAEPNTEIEPNGNLTTEKMIPSEIHGSRQSTEELDKADSCLVSESFLSKELGHDAHDGIGNFPSPRELACLDEHFLAKRCNLGYRASRILKLAQDVVGGKIQLRQLEETCEEPSLSTYDKLLEQLRQIDGFGPFTCANVLMCMGFYHVIPTDSETIRHFKQVHGKTSSIQKVQEVVETIYGRYSPFQFLAYWAEVWHFYGQRFGKLSEMPHTDYKLITASNMRNKGRQKNKRNNPPES